MDWPLVTDYTPEVFDRVAGAMGDRADNVSGITDKKARKEVQDELKEAVMAELTDEETDPEGVRQLEKAFRAVMKKSMRERVINEGVRLDGRAPGEIRPLEAEVGVLPRTHGSAIFKRGDTQVLNVSTLGMLRMEQMLDTIAVEESTRLEEDSLAAFRRVSSLVGRVVTTSAREGNRPPRLTEPWFC